MPHLDIVVAKLWPGEKLDTFIDDARRTVTMPHTIYARDLNDGSTAPHPLAATWNDLAAGGRGDLLAFIRTDMVLPSEWDLKLFGALESFPQVGVAIPAFFGDERPVRLVANGPPAPLKEGEPGLAEMGALARWAERFTGVLYMYEDHNASFSVTMMRRSLWQTLLGFDERFRVFGHDHDFQSRMYKDTAQLAASVRSCPVYTKGGMASMDSIMHVYADLQNEYAHLGKARDAVSRDGVWHQLSAEARAEVRADPEYSRLPLSMYSHTLLRRRAEARG